MGLSIFGELILYFALFATTIYTIIFGYHWFSYGSSNRISLTAMFVFLVGAAVLLLSMLVSLQYVG